MEIFPVVVINYRPVLCAIRHIYIAILVGNNSYGPLEHTQPLIADVECLFCLQVEDGHPPCPGVGYI